MSSNELQAARQRAEAALRDGGRYLMTFESRALARDVLELATEVEHLNGVIDIMHAAQLRKEAQDDDWAT